MEEAVTVVAVAVTVAEIVETVAAAAVVGVAVVVVAAAAETVAEIVAVEVANFESKYWKVGCFAEELVEIEGVMTVRVARVEDGNFE